MTVDYHIGMQRYLQKTIWSQMSDQEFRPVYDEWWTSFICEEVDEELKMVFRYEAIRGFSSGIRT